MDKKTFLKLTRAEELKKCKESSEYFIYNYCYIQHPIKGRINFKLYPFQKTVLNDFNDHTFNIILKSRQLGISTLIAGYSLWKCLFVNDYNILIIATKSAVASGLIKKVKIMYDGMPEWIKKKKGRKYDNIQSQEFDNGSKITAASCTDDAGRSGAYSLIVIDEAAFIKERLINDLWSAAWPTLSTGGSAIILSTPCVKGNTKIKIRNKITNEIQEIDIQNLFNKEYK